MEDIHRSHEKGRGWKLRIFLSANQEKTVTGKGLGVPIHLTPYVSRESGDDHESLDRVCCRNGMFGTGLHRVDRGEHQVPAAAFSVVYQTAQIHRGGHALRPRRGAA